MTSARTLVDLSLAVEIFGDGDSEVFRLIHGLEVLAMDMVVALQCVLFLVM